MANDDQDERQGPEGWVFKELGAHGPGWYPPVVEGKVDPKGEHVALCPAGDDRQPGKPLALVGAGSGDRLVVQYLDRSETTVEAVERLFHTCVDDGGPPTFELAYEHAQSTVNKSYANPMWVYRG